MPDVDALTRDIDKIRSAMWDEFRPTVLSKGMFFPDKARLIRAVKIYSVKECREMMVWESSSDVYKVVCRRWFTGCTWMMCARKKKINMWVVGKYIGTHNCEMDTFSENHFNLDVDLISLVLIPHIEVSIRYVFWAFKPSIDGFVHCRPIISIDDTHVYGKYDIKLLIAVAIDANRQIFPLDFAICANESQETWTLFLNHLKEHVVKQSQEPYAYHRDCVRHLKANFQKTCPNKDLHDLMWMAATGHQECKFRRRMESIRQEDERAYDWLMRYELDKWTLHADGGRRWGTLTTNVPESFNSLLKSAREFPVTAMVQMSFKQMAERFVERNRGASELMERGIEFMPIPMKIFEKYRRRTHWHSFLQYCNERNIFEVRTVIHQNQGNTTHTINLCSCGKWSIYHVSCSHAMKFFQHTGFAATQYVDKKYSAAAYLNTYSGQLQQVGTEHYWQPEPFKMVCNKEYLRKLQVQKRTRIRNQMDVGDTIYAHKCGICSQTGHDCRKCPSAGLGVGGNPAPGGSSSNVPNNQGYT
ncbi:uncharacterized protein [Nicotiana tomentosiformis]|uniref:uncharacterized protein n=1 Tax=Nicotiana tomentosiformis TaxID=4098 RepID=UPI00388C5082